MSENAHDYNGLTEDRKKEIVARLRERGAPKECPMCGNLDWTILDGYVHMTVRDKIGNNQFNGAGLSSGFIPLVGLVCEKCGYFSQHAVGVLGL